MVVRAIKGEDISSEKLAEPAVVVELVNVETGNEDDEFSEGMEREYVKYAQTMVFVNTADAASRLAFELDKSGVRCAEYHKFVSDAEKQESLKRFRDEEVSVLVCTDHASRGYVLQMQIYFIPRTAIPLYSFTSLSSFNYNIVF